MKRIIVEPRKNWQQKCDEVGFHYYNLNGLYWYEGACYCFTESEIDELEQATQTLHQICLEAVEFVIRENRFTQLAIPDEFAELCRQSWQREEPSLYGRFDLVYDGKHPPKLLEYNADTPTALLEASVVQWSWLEEVFPQADQFNLIHEKLIETFEKFNSLKDKTVYFCCCSDNIEDLSTIEYLRDVAIQAGLETQHIFIEDIGLSEQEFFCDLEDNPILAMFKLYPWEWLIQESFAPYLLKNKLTLIEPAWKMILSNKAILPLLWEMYPNHPNLLPSYYDPFKLRHPYVSKPIFSREGANITIYYGDKYYQTPGEYENQPLIYQSYFQLPNFNNCYPVIGSWIVGNEAVGIGIREDHTPITQNSSLFVPHYFE